MEVGCGARLLQLKLHNFPPKRAYLPRLRLPLPVHGRRRRALVPSARRSACRGGIRGHVPDAPAVGRRRRAERPGRPHRHGRAPVELYVDGRRRIGPALRFGVRCPAPLLGQGSRYDVVHSAVDAVLPPARRGPRRRRGRYRLIVDWIEVWTLAYWRSYLGGLKGTIAWAIQRARARELATRAFCFSRLHERRLRDEGFGGTSRRRRRLRRSARSAVSRAARSRWSSSPGGTFRRRACSRFHRGSPERGSACPSCAPRSSATGPTGRGRAAGRGRRAGRRRRGAGLR